MYYNVLHVHKHAEMQYFTNTKLPIVKTKNGLVTRNIWTS